MVGAPGLSAEAENLSDSTLPVAGARLFSFDKPTYPEAIIVLRKTAKRLGVAITTDSIQNHRTIFDINNSPLVSLAIWRIGLAGKARLGPIWLREQAQGNSIKEGLSGPQRKQQMIEFFKPQFQRLLLDFDFDLLVPGHAWPIYQHAQQAIQSSIDTQLAIDRS
jgi:hypothetical protein